MRGPEGASVQQCTGATRQPAGPVAQVHDEVAGLLGGPGPGRMGGDAQDVHRPGLDLHHEQDVHALEQHRVHVKEVTGKDARRLVGDARRGAGPSLAAARIRRIVPTPTR